MTKINQYQAIISDLQDKATRARFKGLNLIDPNNYPNTDLVMLDLCITCGISTSLVTDMLEQIKEKDTKAYHFLKQSLEIQKVIGLMEDELREMI